MLEPFLVARGGFACKASAGRQYANSRIDNLCGESIVEPLHPMAGHWRCGASNFIAQGWLLVALT